MKRNVTFNATEKTTTRECVIGGHKYKVVSHYVGDKNINDVIEEWAIQKALYEINNKKVS